MLFKLARRPSAPYCWWGGLIVGRVVYREYPVGSAAHHLMTNSEAYLINVVKKLHKGKLLIASKTRISRRSIRA